MLLALGSWRRPWPVLIEPMTAAAVVACCTRPAAVGGCRADGLPTKQPRPFASLSTTPSPSIPWPRCRWGARARIFVSGAVAGTGNRGNASRANHGSGRPPRARVFVSYCGRGTGDPLDCHRPIQARVWSAPARGTPKGTRALGSNPWVLCIPPGRTWSAFCPACFVHKPALQTAMGTSATDIVGEFGGAPAVMAWLVVAPTASTVLAILAASQAVALFLHEAAVVPHLIIAADAVFYIDSRFRVAGRIKVPVLRALHVAPVSRHGRKGSVGNSN